MAQELWTAVDQYINDLLVPSDQILDAAIQDSAKAGLPAIQVSPSQGKMLFLLARMLGARSILEIGTLGGYSTICLARALPAGGKLITLEADSKHAAVARTNIERAGLADIIELRLGQALDSLPQLVAEGRGPFDLIFIDADKENNSDYLSWSLQLSRQGTLIVGDNVVREGAVIDPEDDDPEIIGTRRFNELLAAEPRLTATIIQTVGSKGHDGFALALVTKSP